MLGLCKVQGEAQACESQAYLGPCLLVKGFEACVAYEEATAVVVESEPPRAALAKRHGGCAVRPDAPRAGPPRRVQPPLPEEEQARLAT